VDEYQALCCAEGFQQGVGSVVDRRFSGKLSEFEQLMYALKKSKPHDWLDAQIGQIAGIAGSESAIPVQ